MKRCNKNHKGAIELSANFIVVIVISLLVVVGGLTLFFKLRDNAQNYVDTIDSQTEDRIQSMMLNNNLKVAVYPTDPTIDNGDAVLVGIGISNINDDSKFFSIELVKVDYYDKGGNGPTAKYSTTDGSPSEFFEVGTNILIPAHDRIIKGVMLKMPSGNNYPSGQYVYTIRVLQDDMPTIPYDTVQVYANNP